MRIAFTAALIGTFLAIAVFGVLAMNHGHNRGLGCIAAAAQGITDCHNEGNPFAFLAFHLDAFKSFSTAVVGSPLAGLLLAALALIAVYFAALSFYGNPAPASSALQACQKKRREFFNFPSHRQLNHWLALHEKRDPAESYIL